MSWELIHSHLFYPYESVMKEIFCHNNIIGIQKQYPKNINEAPYTVCFTEKMVIYPKGEIFYTTNLRTGELLHMDFPSIMLIPSEVLIQ